MCHQLLCLFAGSEIGSSFFFNDTATTEIYTLSLHDALPISKLGEVVLERELLAEKIARLEANRPLVQDRKSTRLNSSHANISYAVFCLKKKKHNRLSVNVAYVQVRMQNA